MEMPEAFVSSSVLGGLLLSQMFHVAADRRLIVLLFMPAGLFGAIALARVFPAAEADVEWVAALVALTAATMVADGRFARALSVAAGLLLIPAVRATASFLEVVLSSVSKSLAVVGIALIAGAVTGFALRRFRKHAALRDLALLVSLCSVALMAGPTAITGWQRASIAAEGDETSYAAPSLWMLVPVGLAFLAGFAWRIWRIKRTLEGKKT